MPDDVIKPIETEASAKPETPSWAQTKSSTNSQQKYTPSNVRRLLEQAGGDPMTALENVATGAEERMAQMQRQLDEMQNTFKTRESQLAQEKEELSNRLNETLSTQRRQKVESTFKSRFGDDQDLYEAVLQKEGYELDVDGDKVVARKNGNTLPLDAVVNDEFYNRYPRLKPAEPKGPDGDKPLSGSAPSGKRSPEERGRELARLKYTLENPGREPLPTQITMEA